MVALAQPKTVEECLTLQSHFVGIPKITKKSAPEFYRRGKTIEILGVGFLEPNGRMPTFEEVEQFIGLETDAPKLDAKKWRAIIIGILDDITSERIRQEATREPEKEKASAKAKQQFAMYPY